MVRSVASAQTIGAELVDKLVWSECRRVPDAAADSFHVDSQDLQKDRLDGWLAGLWGTLMFRGPWLMALIFVSLESIAWILTGDGFFGNLTGGVVESLRLDTAVPMWRHMLSGSLMWALGAFQCLGKSFRHGQLAWLHRMSGRLLLLLWFFIVGPTAAYLSLFCGTGPSNAHVSMTIFALVSMDTTLFAYYYFWRGLLVAYRRERGADSLALHGQAMQAALAWTMTILIQRPIQLCVIILRKSLLLLSAALPATWIGTSRTAESVALNVLDHHVGLSVTTAWFGCILLAMIDGPRSKLMMQAFPLDEVTAQELFGSTKAHFAELLFWRLRVPVYLLLRAMVTDVWTVDPNPVPPGWI
eukprot:TRINITY_DN27192_c0_g1_i1.p1 TRINITY_DN27192_c0_g1~~TRINITY_DN27192_c0_g1_i1.p1  ORF type:complete len:357 (-),score=32.01 TRINITY_DN27192_c0_g1_i1:27-1097(-)